MPSARDGPTHDTSQLAEVLDRVLDRGIVIDAEINVNVAGLAIAGIECRIVVAAIETYLEYADAIGNTAPASWRAEPAAGHLLMPWWKGTGEEARNRARHFLDDLEDDVR